MIPDHGYFVHLYIRVLLLEYDIHISHFQIQNLKFCITFHIGEIEEMPSTPSGKDT